MFYHILFSFPSTTFQRLDYHIVQLQLFVAVSLDSALFSVATSPNKTFTSKSEEICGRLISLLYLIEDIYKTCVCLHVAMEVEQNHFPC